MSGSSPGQREPEDKRPVRTYQVAYVMPHAQPQPGDLIAQQFLLALTEVSASRGYAVVVAGPGLDDLQRLIDGQTVDAFIFSGVQADDKRVTLLTQARVPFACLGRTGPGQPQCWVDVDSHSAALAAVEHMMARGYTRLAYVGCRPASWPEAGRTAGFRAGLKGHGLRADEASVLQVDEGTALRKIRSLLAEARPNAIVAGSDRLAAVVYGVAAEARLRIGGDLGVTGFGGSAIADLLHPRLTSVAIPAAEIAGRVLDRALGQVGWGPDERPGEILTARLRPGGSTAPAGRDAQGQAPVPGAGASDASRARGAFPGPVAWPRPGPAPMTRRITISDVAADAGVGVGTVSRVLNGGQHVRATTLRAVQEAIDRLGYRPSHAAAALGRGTPRTVAVVVTHLTRPSAAVRVAGALKVLAEQGYDTILCNVESPAERDRHLETLVPTHRADGILAISLPLARRQLAPLARAGVALVSVDAAAPGVPRTGCDDLTGGRLAAEHLIGLGHRRIGFVGDAPAPRPPAGLGFVSSENRLRGFQRALAAAGLAADPGLVRRGEHSSAAAAEHAAQLLKLPSPPSAIFAASDTQAIGVLAAADRLGVPVPGQLSVVGFDDIESAAMLGLTTVAQPLARSGAEGARRLCALLRGERVSPLCQELPLELLPRASSGPAPAG